MPRLHVVEPNEATGKTAELYTGVEKEIGKVINIFKGMGNSPAALNAYLSLGRALGEGELTAVEREVIALAISEKNECHYCLAAHTAIGAGVGLIAEEALKVRKGEATDPKHEVLVDFVLAIQENKGFVSDADIGTVRTAGYSDGAIAEAVGVVAQTIFTNFFNHVNETEIDFPTAPPL